MILPINLFEKNEFLSIFDFQENENNSIYPNNTNINSENEMYQYINEPNLPLYENENEIYNDVSNDVLKNKRGRKNKLKTTKKSRKTHSNKSFDNLLRKIQVHFLTFLIGFVNDILKKDLNYSHKFSFKQIKTEIKNNVKYENVSNLKEMTVGDILQKDISKKYKRYNKCYNREIFEKIKRKSNWFDELFKMKYLELFNYYYNEGFPKKIFFYKKSEIILSPKTKSFYYLIEEYKDLRQDLIKTVKEVY
jgi:hypothetical protein